jgi:hypothetical protein
MFANKNKHTGTMANVTSERMAMYEETPEPKRAIIEQKPMALFLKKWHMKNYFA